MAKKPQTLLELAKVIPVTPRTKSWTEQLTKAQQLEFDEYMAWLRSGTMGRDRPFKKQAIEQISKHFNTTIAPHTFNKLFDAK